MAAAGRIGVAHTTDLPGAAATSAAGSFNARATTHREQPPSLLTIRPTIYPTPAGNTVTVEDPVSINVHSAGFRDFLDLMGLLVERVEQSNEIHREVGQQIVAELNAGVEYLKAPKPSQKVLTLLLVVPLTAAATIAASTVIQETAKLALKALVKLISPDVDIPL